mgnify:CR=1 FL=1
MRCLTASLGVRCGVGVDVSACRSTAVVFRFRRAPPCPCRSGVAVTMPKRVGKYEIGHTLGQGTFGKVKLATNVETGQQVAIKILDKEKIQKQNMGAQIKKEISIMKMVKHEHVVKLYEVMAR